MAINPDWPLGLSLAPWGFSGNLQTFRLEIERRIIA
jgi:hypothetical protein